MLRAALISTLTLLLCGACSAPTQTVTVPPPKPDAEGSTTAKPVVPVDAGSAPDEPSSPQPVVVDEPCSQDTDCVISCLLPGRCCGLPCQCSRAYHVDTEARMRAWVQANCEGAVCKQVKCPVPSEQVRAICRRGQCVPH